MALDTVKQIGTSGGCIANCPSHSTNWKSGPITPETIITYQHFQEIKDAIHMERKRRYADSNLPNFTYSEDAYAEDIITNNTISKFKKYIDELKSYNYYNSEDLANYPSEDNGNLIWEYANYWNDDNTEDVISKVAEKEILANSLLEIRANIDDLNNDCICNCNYCSCVCNYCNCQCSYKTE
jgi:hypothetical protein